MNGIQSLWSRYLTWRGAPAKRRPSEEPVVAKVALEEGEAAMLQGGFAAMPNENP